MLTISNGFCASYKQFSDQPLKRVHYIYAYDLLDNATGMAILYDAVHKAVRMNIHYVRTDSTAQAPDAICGYPT
jgi:hypothetical protein